MPDNRKIIKKRIWVKNRKNSDQGMTHLVQLNPLSHPSYQYLNFIRSISPITSALTFPDNFFFIYFSNKKYLILHIINLY